MATEAWNTVERDGLPPLDSHTTYIGINSAGYACCFNEMQAGLCMYRTAEGLYRQTSDLRHWRLLDRPAHVSGVDAAIEAACANANKVAERAQTTLQQVREKYGLPGAAGVLVSPAGQPDDKP